MDLSGLTKAELASWPGEDRRHPRRSDRHFLMLESLSAALREELDRTLPPGRRVRVLDVGCGEMPYLPFLAGRASEYVGVDSAPGPRVDVVAEAEALPFDDGSFDVVLCTQVLEHVQEPARVLAEIHRVLAPGGSTLLSTHGVFLFHPDPPDSDQDYWRWTHAGLLKQFRAAGQWQELRVRSNGEAVACLAFLAAQYIDEWGKRSGLRRLSGAILALLNTIAAVLDRRYPPRARVPAGGSLTANYVVTATRAG